MARPLVMFAWLLLLPACFEPVAEPVAERTAAVTVDPVRSPGPCSEVFHHEVVITADPERIFDLLADLPGYAAWNPWIVWARGELVPGGDVTVGVVLGGKVQEAQHKVLVVEPFQQLCWKDAGWNAWFLYGQRCRTLEALPDGTVKVTNELLLDGPLAWLGKLTNGASLDAGMIAENAALKATAEAW